MLFLTVIYVSGLFCFTFVLFAVCFHFCATKAALIVILYAFQVYHQCLVSLSFISCHQAAQIASAMILIQHTEAMNSRVAAFRQHYAKVAADKLEDSLCKFGSILAQGIIDAGSYIICLRSLGITLVLLGLMVKLWKVLSDFR